MSYILVVDDSPTVRSAVSRMLTKAGYPVREACNGEEAISCFESEAPDLVILDMIMPRREGIETIVYLKRAFTSVKVLAMSGGGPAPAQNYLRLAKSLGACGTLTKPFTEQVLLKAISQVLEPAPVPAGAAVSAKRPLAGEVADAPAASKAAGGTRSETSELAGQALDVILDRMTSLPPAPEALPKLLRILDDPDSSVEEAVRLISYDPALTAKLLQVCNSALLGGATPVADVWQAVNRLGLACVYWLVAALNGNKVFAPKHPRCGVSFERIWDHSITAAIAAQLLAEDTGEDSRFLFTAALLHEVGKIALVEAFPESYARISKDHVKKPPRLAEVERGTYGFDHGQAGGRMLSRWNFPRGIVAAVEHQFHPNAAESKWRKAAAVLNVADALASALEFAPAGERAAPQPSPEAMEILNYSSEALGLYPKRILANYELGNAIRKM